METGSERGRRPGGLDGTAVAVARRRRRTAAQVISPREADTVCKDVSATPQEDAVPELPEAELWRRFLEPALTGRRVTGFATWQPGFVRAPLRDPDGFVDAVAGRVVTDVERRSKRLVLRLDDGAAVTLGMGLWVRLELRGLPLEPLKGAQFEFGPAREPAAGSSSAGPAAGPTISVPAADSAPSAATAGPARVASAGVPLFLTITEIALANVRLGRYEPPAEPPPFDALDRRLDGRRLAALAPPRAAVKGFLTDDRFVLGVGNGYSDELLWHARVHPRRSCGSLTEGEWAAVAEALRAVLTAALEAGGEEGFIGPNGRIGTYARPIHHHGGEPCPRCGSPLGSLMIGRRETNFCPVCQPV
jgi:formamidopyrimidine-DNA glycosylase